MKVSEVKTKIIGWFKGFLIFAKIASPVAADVAQSTGHEDVVGDIKKAGAAAAVAEKVIEKIEAENQVQQ